jgi:hypothetical protein
MFQIQTPNFAMSSEDVPIASELPPARAKALAQADGDPPVHHPNCRWTMQYFSDAERVIQVQKNWSIPHNTDLLVPQDLDDWPTDSIFDILYGCVVLKRWGHAEAIEILLKASQDSDHENASPRSQSHELLKQDEDGYGEGRQSKTRHFAASSAGDMPDMAGKVWRHLGLRQERKPLDPTPVCTRDVQMRVLDWLNA